jgi:ABC-type dipeptide/oligopeptide/nickel transport system permease subunit
LTDQRNITPEQRIQEFGQAALGVPAPSGGLHELAPEGGEVQSIASGWRLSAREFASNRLAVIALLVLIAIVLFCFLGPLFYHSNQTSSNPLNASLAPGQSSPLGGGGSHLLGTDESGLDEFGRLMVGGQSALEIGVFAALVSIVIGTLYGAISGLIGGFLDGILMRFVDVLLSIPYLLIVLVLSTKYSGTVISISVVLGVFSWLVPARLVRGEVLTLRERDFVVAAQTMGSNRTRLIFRHLIPNAMSVTIVNVTFLFADAIIFIALLGFLGFGLQFPNTSWGDMLGNAQQYVQNGEWWLVYPVGGLLVTVVLCANLIGDALRDAVDVRLRRR